MYVCMYVYVYIYIYIYRFCLCIAHLLLLLMSFYLSLQVTMLINNMAFDCSRTHYDTNRLLRTCAGHVDRHVEFRPTSVPGRLIMEAFLHLLFRHHTCCFLTGSFVNYVAGNFMSYGAALLFIAKADTRIQNLLF
jgi:hypothetical protein